MKRSRRLSTGDGHPIAVVADRTGLSQDVLRVWERRYGAVQPGRGPGGQRLYTDADVERLRLLRDATKSGRAIGHVAALPVETLARMVGEDVAAREQRSMGTGAMDSPAELNASLLVLAQSLNGGAVDEELRRAAARLGLAGFVEFVAVPLLQKVGEEWHAGRLTPASEHLVTASVHDIVVDVMRSLGQQNGAPRLVVATPAGERHLVGAALIGAMAAIDGWNVLYMGGDLPAEEIARVARAADARAVAVSVIFVENRESTLNEMRTLRGLLPADVLLIAGGDGAKSISADLSLAGILVQSGVAGLLAAVRADRRR
ncbi:MAG: MerR family transcriptional regulator [Gemmatimonadaceae bacterium]